MIVSKPVTSYYNADWCVQRIQDTFARALALTAMQPLHTRPSARATIVIPRGLVWVGSVNLLAKLIYWYSLVHIGQFWNGLVQLIYCYMLALGT